jgi:hypothetical protein
MESGQDSMYSPYSAEESAPAAEPSTGVSPDRDLRNKTKAAKLRHKAAKARMKATRMKERAHHLNEKAAQWERQAHQLDGTAGTVHTPESG